MATVLTLGGLSFGIGTEQRMAKALKGLAMQEGNVHKPVPYPQSASVSSIHAGEVAIGNAIKETEGPKIVLAFSQGAQVVGEWLKNNADSLDAPPPNELSFMLIGNPERRYGRKPNSRGFDGQLLPYTPDNTQYKVTDIARRWDGWCNADNWPDDPGWFASMRLFFGQWVDHSDYSKVDTTKCGVRAVEGNTRYLVAPN